MAVMRRLAADIVKLEEEDEAFIAGFISRIEGIAIQKGRTRSPSIPCELSSFPSSGSSCYSRNNCLSKLPSKLHRSVPIF